ncbi:MAG: hypothetical protein HY814_04640, partial [Candidatus Riflebacteria bacterium]|nr:hypothetical protein [Candidatus Riflebacteria bacterium]
LALLTNPIVLAQMKTARAGSDCPMRLVALEESRFESSDPGRPLFGSRFKFVYDGQNRSGEGREGAFEIWLESPLRESTGRGVDRPSELVLASTRVSLVSPFKALPVSGHAGR